MKYWLLKSEPDVWSIDQQEKIGRKGAPWDGVRNYQAAKNLIDTVNVTAKSRWPLDTNAPYMKGPGLKL